MFAAAPLTRRSAVASAGLSPLLLTACDFDPPVRRTAAGEPVTAAVADSELVASVVAAIGAVAGLVRSVSEEFPVLAAPLEPLSQAHAAHLRVLVGALPEAQPPPVASVPVPPREGPALKTVDRRERRLLRTLRKACVDAASGDLACILASMDASVSQHLTALARQAKP